MKTVFVTLLMIGIACSAQTKPLDWKPCTSVTDTFKAAVDKFNAEHHDGFSIEASCMYSGDPGRKVQPKQQVALTPAEIDRLHVLRRKEDAGFDAMIKYEDELFLAHGIRKPDYHDPCYFFAGIISDTDYITVDPNPMMATDNCTVNWKITPKPAKPPAKKALAPCHDGMWYEGRESICLPDGSVPAVKKGVTLPVHAITSEEMSRLRPDCTGKREYRDGYCKDPTPLDVPAIHKTRSQSVCIGAHGGGSGGDARWECDQWKVKQSSHWTCPDPDAYSLQISVSGKNANCHRIAS